MLTKNRIQNGLSSIIRYSALFFSCALLSACETKHTYYYYMQHPDVLKNDLLQCSNESDKSAERAAQCEIVDYAAEKMEALLTEEQANPELFGMRILNAQTAYANMDKQLVIANQALEKLQSGHASDTQLRAARDDLYKAKKAYEDQGEEIKVLLAVVGMGSPD